MALYVVLIKARLGLQTVTDCEHDMLCPTCSGHRASPDDFYNPDGATMRPDGLHVLSCRETGKGGALGLSSSRHEHLNFNTIDNVIKKLGQNTANTADRSGINKEPHGKDRFAVKVRPGLTLTKQPCRGNILFGSKVLDIVISHPIAQSEPRMVDTPEFAAHNATFMKTCITTTSSFRHMVPLSDWRSP